MDRNEITKFIKNNLKQPLWGNWYIKGEEIGSGAFSSVYIVEAKRMNRLDRAALKIEPVTAEGQLFFDEERKRSFIEHRKKMIENESKIMYKLKKCPYIVSYEEEDVQELRINGNFEGYLFLMRMELLESVSKLIKDKKMDFSEANIIKLAKQIGQGIKAAHDIGAIHRDIKPDNFFLSDDGIYKLGDFNVSKQSNIASTFAGTYGYLAPEIYYAKSELNSRYTKQADIYSFGICLYQLINELRFPFEENLFVEDAINKRMSGESFSKPKSASNEFGGIILKACAFDTNDRYQTIDEMLEDLNRLEGNGEHNLINIEDGFKTVYAGNLSTNETVDADKKSIKIKSDESEIFKDFEIVDGILKSYVGDCKSTEITIPYGVKRIEGEAFSGNTNLLKIHIPEGVTSIGEYAFLNCSYLYEITLPKSLKIIEKGAFQNCSRLQKIIIPELVEEIFSQTFKGCSALSLINIPNSVVSIGKEAFAHSGLQSITLPDSVTNVEEMAFLACKNLLIVKLSKVERVRKRTFSECDRLHTVILPHTLKYIEEFAFDYCSNISNITIPKSVKEINEGAFRHCSDLKVTLFSTTKFHKYAFGSKPKPIKFWSYIFGGDYDMENYKKACNLPIYCSKITILHDDGTEEVHYRNL